MNICPLPLHHHQRCSFFPSLPTLDRAFATYLKPYWKPCNVDIWNHSLYCLICDKAGEIIVCATDETKLWLSLSVKQHRNLVLDIHLCTRIWVHTVIGLLWKETESILLVIHWVHCEHGTGILALLGRRYQPRLNYVYVVG